MDSIYLKLYEDTLRELTALRVEHNAMKVTLERIQDSMAWFDLKSIEPTYTSPLRYTEPRTQSNPLAPGYTHE